MAKYQDAIDWIAANWDTDTLYRKEELDPNADIIRMLCDLFGKTVQQVDVSLQEAIWEEDNVHRRNG